MNLLDTMCVHLWNEQLRSLDPEGYQNLRDTFVHVFINKTSAIDSQKSRGKSIYGVEMA